MHDLVIRGGRVVDGTGAPARTADVAIDGDQIVEVGRVAERGRQEIDADGALVAPGWVDVHTHYDGQAIWDAEMAPSAHHGVTTAVMGNCGVGLRPGAARRRGLPHRGHGGGRGHPRHRAARGHRLAVGDLRPVPRRRRLDAPHHRSRHPGAPRRRPGLRARRPGPRGRPHRRRVRSASPRSWPTACGPAPSGFSTSRTILHRSKHGYVPGHLRRRRRAVGHRRRAGRRRSRPVPVRVRRPARAARSRDDGGPHRAGHRRHLLDGPVPAGPERLPRVAGRRRARINGGGGARIAPQVPARPTGMLFGLQAARSTRSSPTRPSGP